MATEVLIAKSLRKSFKTGSRDIEVLSGVDLEVYPGQSISIRGESGSGKTTLLHLLAGLERPDEGSIFWNEIEITALGNDALARRRTDFLGMVFQAYFLIPELNAIENVILPARIAGVHLNAAHERAERLLEQVGLGERMKSMPATLSGGERQRVAVARALINRPSVLFADEPTGNLDEKSSESVIQLLLNVARAEGSSLVLVTHNATHAAMTDRQYRLSGGVLE